MSGVAFVLDDADLAGLGDQEISAGHSHVGGPEFLAQMRPRQSGQLARVGSAGDVKIFAEQSRNRFDILVHDRRHQMAGPVVADLHDEFTQIGFDDIQSAAYSTPSLTTVRQPLADLAERAVSLLVEAATRPPQPHAAVLGDLPAALVIRDSTQVFGRA